MLTLRAHVPPRSASAADEEGPGAAVRRAYSVATDAPASSPCGFHLVGPQVATLLAPARPPRDAARGWVLVTCPEHAHYRERCLTAAQRFMLSLAWDGVPNEWVEAEQPDADVLQTAGLDLGTHVPIGLIGWDE